MTFEISDKITEVSLFHVDAVQGGYIKAHGRLKLNTAGRLNGFSKCILPRRRLMVVRCLESFDEEKIALLLTR